MTAELTHQLATELLLSGLISVLAVSLLVTVLSVIFVRQRRHRILSRRFERPLVNPNDPAGSYRPSVFDQACRWVVVRSRNLQAVQGALGLHNPVRCSWGEGLSRLTRRKLFVAPPVHGWILVIGPGLPDPVDDVDQCFHFLRQLSRALGDVQFFSLNRSVSHHAWVRVERGRIQRAYVWAGETLWNQGELTQGEKELGLKCLSYGERPESFNASPSSNTEKVLGLAALWSLDPAGFNEHTLSLGTGVAGDVTLSRPH